jgi:hypothetical protein
MFIWAPLPYNCTQWQRPRNSLPRIRTHIIGRHWSARIDDISFWPPGSGFCMAQYSPNAFIFLIRLLLISLKFVLRIFFIHLVTCVVFGEEFLQKKPPQITSRRVLLFRLFSLRAFSYCAEESWNFVLRILFMHQVTYVVFGDEFLQKKPPQITSIRVLLFHLFSLCAFSYCA